jgi:lipoyl(octanoyl) transferase
VPYAESLARQRARRRAIHDGRAPEALWLLEHPPVVTLGRRPAPGTPDAGWLAARGVERHQTERGGLATYHAPGQLVAYLLVDLERRGLGVRHLVARIEDAVIGWLAGRGLDAGRREGLPGVWVGRDKIAALGLHVQRGVSMHGLALNLDPDLAGFGLIVPCGVQDGGVTSVRQQQGSAPSPAAAAPSVGTALIEIIEKRR